MKESIALQFPPSDLDLAQLIFDSVPPDEVNVSKPEFIVKASDASGGVFSQIVIYFAHDLNDLAVGLLATWLYDCFKKSNKKGSRINNQQIVFNKREIMGLIKADFKNQNDREKQRRKDKNRKPKKSS